MGIVEVTSPCSTSSGLSQVPHVPSFKSEKINKGNHFTTNPKPLNYAMCESTSAGMLNPYSFHFSWNLFNIFLVN